MRNDAKVDDFRFPLDLGAPAGSLEAKAPYIDNGLDIPHPSRYYSREFMQKEWQHLWPRVWLLVAATSDVPEPGDFTLFQHGHEEIIVVRQADATIGSSTRPHRGNRVSGGLAARVASTRLPQLGVRVMANCRESSMKRR
jgi:hypothetical protein